VGAEGRAFPSVKYFPVLLRLEGWECAVLGTAEAARPYRAVLEGHGARVRVVVPPVRRGDLVGVRLVVAVGGDRAFHARLYRWARRRGVLCYAVDDPEHSDFIRPAVGERGPVVVAVSTGGASPRMAQVLRDRCLGVVTEADVRLAVLLGALRPRLRQVLPDPAARGAFVDRLMASGVMARLQEGDVETARQMAEALLEAFRREVGP